MNSSHTLRSTSATQPGILQEPNIVETRLKNAFALSTIAWTTSWYWSATKLIRFATERTAIPVDSALFPAPLNSGVAALIIYLLPLLSLFFIFRLTPKKALFTAILQIGCAAFFLFHIAYFSSARWIVLFWISSWHLLLASHLREPRPENLPEIIFFAKLIIVLIFFPAGVGKMTNGYWGGEIFYIKYFESPKYPLHQLILHYLPDGYNWTVAIVLSRAAVIAEVSCIIGLILPFRRFVIYPCLLVGGILIGVGLESTIIGLSIPFIGVVIATWTLSNLNSHHKTLSKATKSRLFITLTAVSYAIITTAILMPFSTSLQHVWIKQHHASQPQFAAWALTHIVPKMYTMENTVLGVRLADNSQPQMLPKSLLTCFGSPSDRIQHYSAVRIFRARCRERLVAHDTAIIVELRSSYRKTCLESHILLEPTFAAGESHVAVKPLKHRDCSTH